MSRHAARATALITLGVACLTLIMPAEPAQAQAVPAIVDFGNVIGSGWNSLTTVQTGGTYALANRSSGRP